MKTIVFTILLCFVSGIALAENPHFQYPVKSRSDADKYITIDKNSNKCTLKVDYYNKTKGFDYRFVADNVEECRAAYHGWVHAYNSSIEDMKIQTTIREIHKDLHSRTLTVIQVLLFRFRNEIDEQLEKIIEGHIGDYEDQIKRRERLEDILYFCMLVDKDKDLNCINKGWTPKN